MSFFQSISNIDVDKLTLIIKKTKDGNLTVFVPTIDTKVKDEAVKNLKPFHISGTPEQLDAEFLQSLADPIVKTAEFVSNVKDAEAHREQQALKTQAEKDRKKAIKDKEDELKKIVKSDKYDPIKDNKRVLRAIEAVKKLDPENQYAKKIKKELLEDTQKANGLFNQ